MARGQRGLRYWLSIDWDFFCPMPREYEVGGEGKKHYLDRWRKVPRSFSPHTVDVQAVLGRLSRLDLEDAELLVSESHSYAFDSFRDFGEEKEPTILHFDDHHDLGYPEPHGFRSKLESGKYLDCSSWLWNVMKLHPKAKLVLVFPQWDGTYDWDSTSTRMPWLTRKMRDRITVCTWPEVAIPSGPVEVVHAARSGAWSAPWHDREWQAFLRRLEVESGGSFYARYRGREKCDPKLARSFPSTG